MQVRGKNVLNDFHFFFTSHVNVCPSSVSDIRCLKRYLHFFGFSKSPHLCEGKLVTDRSSVSFLIHIMLHILHPVIFILFFWFYSKLKRFILTIQLYRFLRSLLGSFQLQLSIMTFFFIEESFWVLFGWNYDLSFDDHIFV